MSVHRDFLNILSSTLALVIAITIITGSSSSTISNARPRISQASSDTPENELEDQLVESYEVENAGTVDEQEIIERTDFSKKIIQFVPGTSEEDRDQLLASIGVESAETIDSNTVVADIPDQNLEDAEETLSNSSTVNSVETDYAVGLLSQPDWGVVRIGADKVWETTTGSGVAVAVIDTGIDSSHPELTGKVIAQYDFYNNDAFSNDDHGHGTFVSGVAAAAENNVGIIGVGPGISIMSAKVLGADGYGYLSDVVEGVNWAVENGASVVNMSLGTTYDSSTLKAAVDRAAANGLVLVAAAGNTGDQMTFPAAYDSVIAVGATDSNDNLASFSARGSELVAPGVDITGPVPGGGYYTASGTSASSPHVAGVVADMISQGMSDIRSTLRNTSEDLGEEGRDFYFGYGLVSAPAALGLDEAASELNVEITTPSDGDLLSGRSQRIMAVATGEVIEMRLYVDDQLAYITNKDTIRWNWKISNTGSSEHVLKVEAENSQAKTVSDQVTVTVIQSTNSNRPATSSAKRNNQSQDSQDTGQSTIRQDTVGSNPQTNTNSDSSDEVDETDTKSVPEQANENAQRGRGVRGASTEAPVDVLIYFIQKLLGL